MHQKALRFSDTDTAVKVMKSNNPVEQKALGRQVASFDQDEWRKEAKPTLIQGLCAKFGQNELCKHFLKNTGEKSIGEACEDSFWGIGMSLSDNELWNEGKWKGNLMGKSLMEIRGEI